MTVPNFFLVGHPKCGTTALYQALRSHRDVFMPVLKEPHFLAEELRYRSDWGDVNGLPRTMEEYLSLFDPAGPTQICGEASACYLWTQTAAAGIADLRPDARVVAIFREPASFIRSLHLQLVQTHVEPHTDLRRALELEDDRRRGRDAPTSPSNWAEVLAVAGGLVYADFVDYVAQLRRFEEQLPFANIHVVIYDDFRSKNAAVMKEILTFLDLPTDDFADVPEANPTVRVRSQRMNRTLRGLYMGDGRALGPIKAGVKRVVPSSRLRRYAVDTAQQHLLYAKPKQADASLMQDLRYRFVDEVIALSDHLGRDLVDLWGYGQVA